MVLILSEAELRSPGRLPTGYAGAGAGAGGHRVIFSNKVVQQEQQQSCQMLVRWSWVETSGLCPHPLASPGPGYLICLAPDPGTRDESRDLQLLTINLPRNGMGFKSSTRPDWIVFAENI